jgi:hypothetical protein
MMCTAVLQQLEVINTAQIMLRMNHKTLCERQLLLLMCTCAKLYVTRCVLTLQIDPISALTKNYASTACCKQSLFTTPLAAVVGQLYIGAGHSRCCLLLLALLLSLAVYTACSMLAAAATAGCFTLRLALA